MIEDGLKIERLFDEALRHPSPPYALAERLARRFPELAMLETESYLFDVRAFAAAEQCTYAEREHVFQQYSAHYNADDVPASIPGSTVFQV